MVVGIDILSTPTPYRASCSEKLMLRHVTKNFATLVLSHPHDRGHEFVFKVGESNWSKVEFFLKEWFHLTDPPIACQSRGACCRDRIGGSIAKTEDGRTSYRPFVD